MLDVLVHLIAAVLVVSGVDKVRAPRPAGEAMARAGLPTVPGRLGAVVPGAALGVAECGVGLWVLASPSVTSAIAMAVTYVLFAGFVLVLRAVDATASCGCFGAGDTPPTVAHATVNLAAATVAAAAAIVGRIPSVAEVFRDGVGQAVPYAILVVTGTAFVLLGPALLADLQAARAGRGAAGVRAFSLNNNRRDGRLVSEARDG